MFNIKTQIGNFGTFKDFIFRDEIHKYKWSGAECTYCFEPVCGKIKISKEELEELAKKIC